MTPDDKTANDKPTDEKYVSQTPSQEGTPLPDEESTQATRDQQQEELARKLPTKTQPAEEWGERLSTGKHIAQTGAPQDQKGD
jgi:hypothetical protein